MKEEDRLKKIRDLLLQWKKANWTKILEETGIQSKELSYDLMKLIRNREITTEQDTKDRRITWYMLKDVNKAQAESRRYETTEFIENMKEPISYETKRKIGRYTILISAFGETQTADRQEEQTKLQQTLDKALKNLPKDNLMGLEAFDFLKLAIVFAYQKEGKA